MTLSPALKADQLTVSFHREPILWDLSFEVPTGSLVAIVGPNGAGKSTLLRTAIGAIRPMSGTVQLMGLPYKQVRKQIAYVPQRETVEWDFPIRVIDVVLMGRYGWLGLFRWPRKADWAAAYRHLDSVGLADLAERQISELSGGQQQRVFLARALLQEASIYLLDEPFAGVDAASESVIIEILRQLRNEGKTVVAVHHDLHSVPSYFDWALLLNMRLVACGPVGEVFTPKIIEHTYGKDNLLLNEALKANRSQSTGLV